MQKFTNQLLNTYFYLFQEGFLLGEIVHKECSTITDNDKEQINITKTIKINSAIPYPQNHYFYSGAGKIDESKLKELLKDEVRNVVAWYKFQYSSSFRFTFRDKLIHKQLTDFFGILTDQFTCCLLICELSKNQSTHMLSQNFVRYRNKKYENVPFTIPNLSELNNSYISADKPSDTFTKIVSTLDLDLQNIPAIVAINKIENALQNYIESVVVKLAGAERQLFDLEQEIRQLEITKKDKKSNAPEPETADSEQKIDDNPKALDLSTHSKESEDDTKQKMKCSTENVDLSTHSKESEDDTPNSSENIIESASTSQETSPPRATMKSRSQETSPHRETLSEEQKVTPSSSRRKRGRHRKGKKGRDRKGRKKK